MMNVLKEPSAFSAHADFDVTQVTYHLCHRTVNLKQLVFENHILYPAEVHIILGRCTR